MVDNVMTNGTKTIDGSWYSSQQLDFDRRLVRYRYESIKAFFKLGKALELGTGDGVMTRYLVGDFTSLTSVDGSRELLNAIPDFKNLTKVHSFFEDYQPTEKFDTIIMEHILEHVDNPTKLLTQAKGWLAEGGRLIVGVPNALSIHRLVAVKMGMLASPFELNQRDHDVGHQRVYCMETLLNDISHSGLVIEKTGGVFFKPVSNGQIERDWSEEMMDGFYQLGKDFQDNAAEIYAVCTK